MSYAVGRRPRATRRVFAEQVATESSLPGVHPGAHTVRERRSQLVPPPAAVAIRKLQALGFSVN